MDRFFYAAMISALLMLAPARGASVGEPCVQPVFFSMLFPQLAPQECLLPFMEMTPGEAVCL